MRFLITRLTVLLLLPFTATSAVHTTVAHGNSEAEIWKGLRSGLGVSKIEDGIVHFAWEEPGEKLPEPDRQRLLSLRETETLPKPLKTKIFGLKHLGMLYARNQGHPYLVLTGKDCADCPNGGQFVYLLKPDGKDPNAFVHPGEVRDRKTNRLLFEGRSFFGECLPGKNGVYVVFQKEKLDRRRYLQRSVYVAEMNEEESNLTGKIIVRRKPQLKTVLSRVKQNRCVEIKGVNRKTIEFSLNSGHTLRQ